MQLLGSIQKNVVTCNDETLFCRPGLPLTNTSLLPLDPNYDVDDNQPFLFHPIAYAKLNPFYFADSPANIVVIGTQNMFTVPMLSSGKFYLGDFL